MPSHGVHAVAWALVLRAVLQVAFLVPALGPVQRPDWQAAGGPAALRRLAPLMAGALYYRADPIVERVLASFAPAGHLSLLHLGQQAYGAATQIVTRALINPMMPGLARAAAAHAWAEFAAAVRRRLVLVLALAVGGMGAAGGCRPAGDGRRLRPVARSGRDRAPACGADRACRRRGGRARPARC